MFCCKYFPNPSTVHILVAGAAYVDTNVACTVLAEEFSVVALDLVSVLAAAGEDEPDLVSDERTAEIVAARVGESDCVENGFVLVGFPLTKEQAMVLDQKNVYVTCRVRDRERERERERARAKSPKPKARSHPTLCVLCTVVPQVSACCLETKSSH